VSVTRIHCPRFSSTVPFFPSPRYKLPMLENAARGAVLFLLLLAAASLCPAQTSVLTYHNDNFHTGLNPSETVLKPSNVNAATFGKLSVLPADGKVDGQPLYVSQLNIPGLGARNVVFVATEHDTVYAYDADQGGSPLWQASMLLPGETPSDTLGCAQVTPEIGVTATPVIDLGAGPHGTIYLVAMSKSSDGFYHQRLHALDITSGNEQFGGPSEINAVFPGNGDSSVGGLVYFDPKMYKDRAALVLSGGVIYTSWASHCDARPYTGWVIGYDQYSLFQTLVYNFTPDGEGGTIWGGGAGPAVDAEGNLFFQLANGTFDQKLDGVNFPYAGDFGNSFVKLSAVQRIPRVLDYWTMHDSVRESDADIDLGSGGVMLLPDLIDAAGTVRRLGLGAGKDTNIYVFDRDNMGRFDPESDSTIYEELRGALSGPQLAAPAWFDNTVYFGAIGDHIRAFSVAGARLSPQPVTTKNTFGYAGTTPSVSANGKTDAILWALENADPVVLHAYDATNISRELYNSHQAANGRDNAGEGIKWMPPTIADGKVFVPLATGVGVFGLLDLLPDPPTEVAATAFATRTINVTWTASPSSGVTYSVFRSTNPDFTPAPENQIVTGITDTIFRDRGVTPGNTYYYLVCAIGNRASPPSNEADATTEVQGGPGGVRLGIPGPSQP
jgi:hypothetical protein